LHKIATACWQVMMIKTITSAIGTTVSAGPQ
jgi:hypothetical protein